MVILEKLTSVERLTSGLPFLLTAVVVHGLALAGGLATLRMRAIRSLQRLEMAHAGGVPALVAAESRVAPVPWVGGEAWLVLALPLFWWLGFILGPEDPAAKTVANSLSEPLIVGALGVAYLVWRRATECRPRAHLLHFAALALALATAGLLGWLLPVLEWTTLPG